MTLAGDHYVGARPLEPVHPTLVGKSYGRGKVPAGTVGRNCPLDATHECPLVAPHWWRVVGAYQTAADRDVGRMVTSLNLSEDRIEPLPLSG